VRLSAPSTPLARASWALIATTAINAVLGFAYWVLAARLYPAHIVGEAAGAISAMMFVTSIGWLGLQFVLIRFIPVAGDRTGLLIVSTYGAAGLTGLLAAGVFLLAFADTAGLGFVAASTATVLAFLAGSAAWIVFSLQDPALIGLRRSDWVPIENAAFGTLKAIVLVAAAGTGSAWAIFGSWTAAAAVFAGLVNVLMFRKLVPHASHPTGALPARRGLLRFAAGQHAVAVVAAVPDTLVPLLVLGFLGAESNAHYYAAWAIGFSLRLLAVNIADALLSEAARAEDDLAALLHSAARLTIGVLVPLTLVVIAGAALITTIFGAGYGEATGLLRIFALSLLPFGLVTGILTLERVRQRNALAMAVVAVSTGVTIAADIVLIPDLGVEGAGWGWLIGQTFAAVTGVVLLMRQAHRNAPADG
jgi:O-antigen/teichoic acid export membrane protein